MAPLSWLLSEKYDLVGRLFLLNSIVNLVKFIPLYGFFCIARSTTWWAGCWRLAKSPPYLSMRRRRRKTTTTNRLTCWRTRQQRNSCALGSKTTSIHITAFIPHACRKKVAPLHAGLIFWRGLSRQNWEIWQRERDGVRCYMVVKMLFGVMSTVKDLCRMNEHVSLSWCTSILNVLLTSVQHFLGHFLA